MASLYDYRIEPPSRNKKYEKSFFKDGDIQEYLVCEQIKKENIILLHKFETYDLIAGDEDVVIYPAHCQVDTSPKNNLGWIKEQEIPTDGKYRIGIAHGAVEGHTIDTEGVYFLMTEDELKAIPMDVWLIGHTHVMFPDDLTSNYKSAGTIFNAGTHVQTDVRNNTEGNCFIIEIEKTSDGKASVRAKQECFTTSKPVAKRSKEFSFLY